MGTGSGDSRQSKSSASTARTDSPGTAAVRRAVRVDAPGAARDAGGPRGTHKAPPLSAAGDIASFDDAMAWLSGRINVERTPPAHVGAEVWKLDRMRALLAALDHPENDVDCVHVAGSKGKGSTVEMAAAGLSGCGLTTGIYTSPHLVDIRERVRIGTEMMPEADFARWCREVGRASAGIAKEQGDATYFEILTAMALCHFRERAVDVAVIEVGLGGRLDATNLVRPRATAVTAIQLEHTQMLGDTHAKIAREKAGIFKPGVPALTIPQRDDVLAVFREVAADVGSPLQIVGEDIEFTSRFEHSRELGHHCKVCLYTPRSAFEHVAVPLKGEHQALNCGLALALIDRLREAFPRISEGGVAKGLAATPNRGRLEIVSTIPRILVDGAHTPDSVEALIKTLGSTSRFDSMVVVFGCASDKDLAGMAKAIGQGADKIYFTKAAGNPRAVEPRDLAKKYAEVTGRSGVAIPSLDEAMQRAIQTAGRDDLIVVTGSYYVAGEAKAWVERHRRGTHSGGAR